MTEVMTDTDMVTINGRRRDNDTGFLQSEDVGMITSGCYMESASPLTPGVARLAVDVDVVAVKRRGQGLVTPLEC